MNFLSQFFAERSAHKNGLGLFLAFRVHFREADIDELEHICPTADHSCLLNSPCYRETGNMLLKRKLKNRLGQNPGTQN